MTHESTENIRRVCSDCASIHLKPDPQYLNKPIEWFFGKFCKAAFKSPTGRTEYMWIKIVGQYESEHPEELVGILNNDPITDVQYKNGDSVAIGRNEIIEVLKED